MEECVLDMGRRRLSVVAVMGATINNCVINRGVCIRHGVMVKLSKAKVVQTVLYLKEECA